MNSIQEKTARHLLATLPADYALLFEWLVESLKADERYNAHLADFRQMIEDSIKRSIPIPIPDEQPVPPTELHAEYVRALGYLTALYPTMEVDAQNPMKMAEQILHYVNKRHEKQLEILRHTWSLFGSDSMDGAWASRPGEWQTQARVLLRQIHAHAFEPEKGTAKHSVCDWKTYPAVEPLATPNVEPPVAITTDQGKKVAK